MRAHRGIRAEKKTSAGVANGDRWGNWRAEKEYQPLRGVIGGGASATAPS